MVGRSCSLRAQSERRFPPNESSERCSRSTMTYAFRLEAEHRATRCLLHETPVLGSRAFVTSLTTAAHGHAAHPVRLWLTGRKMCGATSRIGGSARCVSTVASPATLRGDRESAARQAIRGSRVQIELVCPIRGSAFKRTRQIRSVMLRYTNTKLERRPT